MKCPHCGQSNFDWARKCDRCGRPLTDQVLAGEGQLRLNSLSRFSKQSPRLHLEEHSHCEVPAGCGGVVLRWYNPSEELPVLLRAYTPTPARLFINGAAPSSARPMIRPGRVSVTFEFDVTLPGQALFMFVASHSAGYGMTPPSSIVTRSAPDGSWRFSISAPPDGWTSATFDADPWPKLVERPLAPPQDKNWATHNFEQLVKCGAVPLGLPLEQAHDGRRAWVHKSFTLSREVKKP